MEADPKAYVKVNVDFFPDGKLLPRSITWEDGHEYAIAEILDIRRAASLKAGGAGIRYTIKVGGKVTFIFLEEDRWFVERR